MKRLTDSDINKDIANAIEKMCPDKAEEIWEQPVERASGTEWYLDGIKRKKGNKGKIIPWLSAAAACFVLCFLSYYLVNMRTMATIYMDVNPSIELRVNSKEKVTLAKANNKDGELVLENMDLKNTDLNTAVNAILGSMVKHGYLDETHNMILLSVDSKDQSQNDALRGALLQDIQACMDSLLGEGNILDQNVDVDDVLDELAEKYSITPGKAALLQRIVEAYPTLDYKELAKLSVKDLAMYLKKQGIDVRRFVNYTGKDLDDILDYAEEKNENENTKEVEISDNYEAEDRADYEKTDNEDKKEPEDEDVENVDEVDDSEAEEPEDEED